MRELLWSRVTHVFGVHRLRLVDITDDGMLVYRCRWCCAESVVAAPPD